MRTTVGLPLHRCHNAATEKGVSINRKKENRGSRLCTKRRRAIIAPHSNSTGQQPPSHRLKATSSSTPTRDQKEKNQTEVDEEGKKKKKPEAGVSARGRRRKAAANITTVNHRRLPLHRHQHHCERQQVSLPPFPLFLLLFLHCIVSTVHVACEQWRVLHCSLGRTSLAQPKMSGLGPA